MRRETTAVTVLALLALIIARGEAASAAEASTPPAAGLPVKEVTVFKDGHAFVLQEGDLPVDAAGNVVLDQLPAPVLGTFWPYSAAPDARLAGVVAGQRKVSVDRSALSIREMLEGNAGAEVLITETGGVKYVATIVAVPEAEPVEAAPPAPGASGPRAPRTANLVLLKTDGGTKALPIDRIQDLTFLGAHGSTFKDEESRNLMTLKLEWAEGKRGSAARVGMAYLQKGLRWIPSYKVTLDGKGNAAVDLQATLVNELVDLDDVTVHLVIGVPTIAFKDTLDPLSLQKAMANLSPYFREDAQTRYALSNAIMSQSARMGESRSVPPDSAPEEPGAEAVDAAKGEDLFIFTVKRITLRKGERMSVPVASYSLKYRDVYALDLPFAPPADLERSLNTDQERELARLLRSPKAMHKVRLENNAPYPLTTAPALILKEGRVLAQGMMTYTAMGGTSDLPITAAIDIRVKKSEVEAQRTPRAENWNGTEFARIDMKGKVSLTSYLGQPVDVEVTRQVLGTATRADHDGAIEQGTIFEPDGAEWDGLPPWWRWYSWPPGWIHLNGLARFKWSARLEPGKRIDLEYGWHYYWR